MHSHSLLKDLREGNVKCIGDRLKKRHLFSWACTYYLVKERRSGPEKELVLKNLPPNQEVDNANCDITICRVGRLWHKLEMGSTRSG